MSSQNKFTWIDADVVSAIHEAQIAEHGGSLGVRDPGLSNSALSRARNAAAHYALGVIKNHPFVDGNKRVGAVLLELFLELNGFELVAGDEDMLAAILAVAAGELDDKTFIRWVRKHSVRRP